MLMLDGLYLPGSANLVRDLQSVGAEAFATYCWRRANDGSWLPTYVAPEHLVTCRKAGILAAAIIVPGSRPAEADIALSLDAAEQLGWSPAQDLIAIDLETYSLPPAEWVSRWVTAARGRGWSVGRYGQASVLSNYALADWSWIARWRTSAGGDIFPVPDTPPGGAWQYSHADTVPNGGTDYDASVVDPALWPASPDPAQGGVTAFGAISPGGFHMGNTMGGFQVGGIDHCFELSADGDVLWGRTAGGPGGHVHVGFWNLGGSGPGPVCDLAAWPSPASGRNAIIVRTKYAGGHVLEKVIDADAPDFDHAAILDWYQPDDAGPFRVLAGIAGPAGPQGEPGPAGPPGPGVDDDHIRHVVADAITNG